MSKYYSGFIGLDVKTRRKGPRPRRNRFTTNYSRWLSPVLIATVTLGFIIVAAIW